MREIKCEFSGKGKERLVKTVYRIYIHHSYLIVIETEENCIIVRVRLARSRAGQSATSRQTRHPGSPHT